jgi:putative PIN family toxin of toxin-antitoxin system
VKIVLDTNVFISGIFFSGPPHRILKAWRDGLFQIVLTRKILDEYERVGSVFEQKFPSIDLTPILDLVTINAELVPDRVLPRPVCSDRDDDKFIACALASKSKLIVSGDKHLLNVSGFQGIEIITPRSFVETYLAKPVKKYRY